MRHQELCFSAFVLGAAIASDNCRHSRNMRPEPPIFQCETLAWLFLICDMPLPVAGEIDALTALHCQRGHAAHLIAIRDAAVVRPVRRSLARSRHRCRRRPGKDGCYRSRPCRHAGETDCRFAQSAFRRHSGLRRSRATRRDIRLSPTIS
jgi:hypothetical protein